MKTIGKLVATNAAAHDAAYELVMAYDKLGDKLDAMPITRQYFEMLDLVGETFADIVELVAFGMEVAHERPTCPVLKTKDLAAKTMKVHGVAPKAAPRERGKR